MRLPRLLVGIFNLDRTEVRQGDVTLYARHPILDDLAQMLVGPAYSLPQGRPIKVMVGAHAFRRRLLPPGPRMAIQTEQLADAEGRPLWAAHLGRGLGRHMARYGALIDLAGENAPAYERLAAQDQARVLFGPYLFPDHAPHFDPGTSPELVFFGAMNERRAAAIARISALRPVRVLPEGTHGAALQAAIAPAAGVLNLHFAEGVYTEAPRLLVAHLAGKPVFSEPLAPPLVVGRHYFSPEAEVDAAARAAVFAAFRDEFASRYRFSVGLSRALDLAPS